MGQIFRDHATTYQQKHRLTPQQAKVIGALSKCRTAALGGHIQACRQCGSIRVWYNSCRDRHCPKCQSVNREQWLAQRRAELLPVKHFHVVFTIPPVLHDLFRYNERLAYDALFQTVWSSLRTLCTDPKYLGAQPGMLAVLHTWGQNLHYHPHIHALVPAGGLSFDRCRWKHPHYKRFLVPVRALSSLFRGRLVTALRLAYTQGQLRLPPGTSLSKILNAAMQNQWVVYAKPPFGQAYKLLDYLGQYLKRVAISNDRLIDISRGKVSFHYRDYADHNRKKVMQLDVEEFMRRFIQHILPAGFCKVRYYGILANRNRHKNLAVCHYLLGKWYAKHKKPFWKQLVEYKVRQLINQCPFCQIGQMEMIATIVSVRFQRAPPVYKTQNQ